MNIVALLLKVQRVNLYILFTVKFYGIYRCVIQLLFASLKNHFADYTYLNFPEVNFAELHALTSKSLCNWSPKYLANFFNVINFSSLHYLLQKYDGSKQFYGFTEILYKFLNWNPIFNN